jgi:hypothetical protein
MSRFTPKRPAVPDYEKRPSDEYGRNGSASPHLPVGTARKCHLPPQGEERNAHYVHDDLHVRANYWGRERP